MSRNFELMTHIEGEARKEKTHAQPASGRAAVKGVATELTDDFGGAEMSRLVQKIFLSGKGRPPRQVVFCGVDSESGSSLVCASAGRILAANTSRPVCLVDANLRTHRLSALFVADPASESVDRTGSVGEQCHRVGDNLWIAGRDFLANTRDTVPSVTKLKQIFAELCGVFDFVLIDAPGPGVSGDAAILGQAADATILVVEADHTRRLAARKAKDALDAAGVPLLGTVLHNRSFPIPKSLYDRL